MASNAAILSGVLNFLRIPPDQQIVVADRQTVFSVAAQDFLLDRADASRCQVPTARVKAGELDRDSAVFSIQLRSNGDVHLAMAHPELVSKMPSRAELSVPEGTKYLLLGRANLETGVFIPERWTLQIGTDGGGPVQELLVAGRAVVESYASNAALHRQFQRQF